MRIVKYVNPSYSTEIEQYVVEKLLKQKKKSVDSRKAPKRRNQQSIEQAGRYKAPEIGGHIIVVVFYQNQVDGRMSAENCKVVEAKQMERKLTEILHIHKRNHRLPQKKILNGNPMQKEVGIGQYSENH